jgi:hypothetical protein
MTLEWLGAQEPTAIHPLASLSSFLVRIDVEDAIEQLKRYRRHGFSGL